MKKLKMLGIALVFALGAARANADLPTKKVLTLAVAKKIAAAAEAEANKRGSTVVIVAAIQGGER